jgi:hypothetical protein
LYKNIFFKKDILVGLFIAFKNLTPALLQMERKFSPFSNWRRG